MDAMSSSFLGNPDNVQIAKEALVAGFLLVCVVYVLQYLQHRRPKRSWLKLRRDSPDPEKNDDPGRFAAQRFKPTDRQLGSKSDPSERK